MPNAPVSFTVTCSNNSFIKKWWKRFSFSLLSSTPAFFCRLVSHINNSSKTFANLTKFGTEKHTTLQLALNLQYKRKSEKTHLLKRIFLHREKDETKNLSPFLCKRPFDHGKEFLKSSQLHFKEFHFKSTSSSSSMVEKQASHWNKKSFRDVFRTQSKIYNTAFLH